MKLIIEVDIGNDATLSSNEVAVLLIRAAARLTKEGLIELVHQEECDSVSNVIKDTNGNTVGSMTVQL